jgi:hypothetical protein
LVNPALRLGFATTTPWQMPWPWMLSATHTAVNLRLNRAVT